MRKKDVKPKAKKESTKIPKFFVVAGVKYTVERAWCIKNEAGEMLDGDVSFDEKKIRIAHGLSKEEVLDTYVHECIHVIFREFGLHTFISKDIDELLTLYVTKELLKNFTVKPVK